MQFIMIPSGFSGVILTDDYTDSEIAHNVHIAHFRRDMDAFGLKYPCEVFDSNMHHICTLK